MDYPAKVLEHGTGKDALEENFHPVSKLALRTSLTEASKIHVVQSISHVNTRPEVE